MLTKFTVKNYRGFSEKLTFDLSRPSKYDFNSEAVKNGFIKDAIVYGPNGSGKSNLGFAIFDIVHHLTLKTKQADYGRNFAYAGAMAHPVFFEYTFVFGKDTVVYSYAKNYLTLLIEERLSVNGEEWFHRNGGLSLRTDLFPISEETKTMWTNPANNSSFVNFLLSTFPLDSNNPLVKMNVFVNNMLFFRNLDQRSYIGYEVGITSIEQYVIQHNLVSDLSTFLFDISGQKFEFMPTLPSDTFLTCNIKGTPYPFNLILSTGTNSLLLFYYWYVHMRELPFVFIDEFDAFYHFELSKKVCKKLFELSQTQVILTTHNTHLMSNDLLRPDCNFILDTNIIKPLNERTEKELRLGHNIEKLYRGGTFSA